MISDYYLQTCKKRKKKVVKAVIIMINEEVELPIFSKFGETKNKSVICFWKLPFGLLENRKKKKKKSFFWFSFSPEKLCDERRTTPFHFLNNYPHKI